MVGAGAALGPTTVNNHSRVEVMIHRQRKQEMKKNN
jgi:hypothetical protein